MNQGIQKVDRVIAARQDPRTRWFCGLDQLLSRFLMEEMIYGSTSTSSAPLVQWLDMELVLPS
jgi:hypothetical protein